MKKIEFLNNLAKEVWGPEAEVVYDGCGQSFDVWLNRPGGRKYLHHIWVDNLVRGRCSIKIKYYQYESMARRISQEMYNVLYRGPYTIDSTTKAAPFRGHTSRFGSYWVARLICDRYWD